MRKLLLQQKHFPDLMRMPLPLQKTHYLDQMMKLPLR
jgi:hypothetical protein